MVRQQEQQITCSNTNNTAADNSGRHDPAVAAMISMAAKETMTAINGTAKVEKFYTGSDDRNNSNNVSSYHPPPDLCWQKKQQGHQHWQQQQQQWLA
jgi:chorismate synthase